MENIVALYGKAEINNGIINGINALILVMTPPELISEPLDFCAKIILSNSSISVGINLNAIDIIILN